MFIPLIIAILMGLITPTTNNTNCNGGTVYVSNNGTNGDDPNDPGNGDGDGDGEGEGEGETGIGGGPGTGTGTGGGSGQNPPPPPPPPPHG